MSTYLIESTEGVTEEIKADSFAEVLRTLYNKDKPYIPAKIFIKVTQYELLYKRSV
jgi:hypothetical protein